MNHTSILAKIRSIRTELDALELEITSDGCAPHTLGERPQTQAARERARQNTALAYTDMIRKFETWPGETLSLRFLRDEIDGGRNALTRALAQAIAEGRVRKIDGGFQLAT